MSKRKSWQDMSKFEKVIGVIGTFVLFIVLLSVFTKPNADHNSTNPTASAPAATHEVAKEQVAKLDAAKQSDIDNAVFITERDLALVVKDPESNKGKIFKIWGEIEQFDSATGADTFRAYISPSQQQYWALDGENALLKGKKEDLKDYVKDDIFIATVEVSKSQTYDNTMGGGNTVPYFTIHKIERK